MQTPIFKVVASDGCRSYLIGCPTTRACLLVDPKVGREDLYRSLMEAYGLELVGIFDTHTHADHLSAAPRFVTEDVPLYMSHQTPVKRAMRHLRDGAEVTVGRLTFHAIEVPGHTPDSLALYGHGLVLTGDSLFIGSLARADFLGSDPAQLFTSVRERLLTLPEGTLAFPGHDYGDLMFTTVDHEGEHSEALRHQSGADYAASLGATPGAGNSDAVNANLELNLAPDPELPESAGNVAACCAAPSAGGGVKIEEIQPGDAAAVHASLPTAAHWVDVRDPFEYEHGHIDGTVNVPLSELGFHLDEFRTKTPLYLSCRSGVRSATAAKTLKRLGVAVNPISVGGGILGWQDQGLKVNGAPAV
jgi:glyoxylase-like metal-dependent hydrolase (beta-lactamase superfamily II)/rhodanese-related sulfurtransferase